MAQLIRRGYLEFGNKGYAVKILQEKLADKLEGRQEVEIDEIFCSETENALKLVQADYGLTSDGTAGPDTFLALELQELIRLRAFMKGNVVRLLHDRLNEFLKVVIGLEEYDGQEYGQETYCAVEDFQVENGLTVDGIAGPKTLLELDIPKLAMERLHVTRSRAIWYDLEYFNCK